LDASKDFAYLVITRDEERTIDSRAEAVALAKSITAGADISVTVEREDGRERMQFRQGSLVDFVYEIRAGRPSREGEREERRAALDDDDDAVLDDDEEES
jgi:hypothetical protein